MNKERDSFFSNYGYTGYNTNMMPNMPIPNVPTTMNNMNNNLYDRLNKIESDINSINSRLNMIESKLTTTTNSTDYNFANSMYMV